MKKKPKDHIVKFNKRQSEFRKEGKIKECFHPQKDSCSEEIIKAHAIQQNGRLSLIADEYMGDNQISDFKLFH